MTQTLLFLLVVVNATAVGAKKLLGAAFAHPLDGGALFVDGQPIFGPSKTIRGIVASVLATSICAALMELGWEVGTLGVLPIGWDIYHLACGSAS